MAIVALLYLLALGQLAAQERSPDAATKAIQDGWLVFSLPDELQGAGGIRREFRSPKTGMTLTVIPLLDHPGVDALKKIETARLAIANGPPDDRYAVSNPLVHARQALKDWQILAFNLPEYKLAGAGNSPHPLSLSTKETLEELIPKFLAVQKTLPESPANIEAIKAGLAPLEKQLQSLTKNKVHRRLLQLARTESIRGWHPLTTLSKRDASVENLDLLVISNQRDQTKEEIVFVTIDNKDYAFCFRTPQQKPVKLVTLTRVFKQAHHVSTKPTIKQVKPKKKPVELGKIRPLNADEARIKWATLILLAFFLGHRAVKRAGLAWEICRSRESFSSRETANTFTQALFLWTGFGLILVASNFLFPTKWDLLTLENIALLHLIPILAMIMLGALLPTLGARLGCRYGKFGCQTGTGLGFFAGLVVSATFVLWLVSANGGV